MVTQHPQQSDRKIHFSTHKVNVNSNRFDKKILTPAHFITVA